MEKKALTAEQKHRNSLLRIAAECNMPRVFTQASDIWQIEDAILQRLGQGKLLKKRGMAEIKRLRKENETLRQTTIADIIWRRKTERAEVKNENKN
jgi:hypothetical protein